MLAAFLTIADERGSATDSDGLIGLRREFVGALPSNDGHRERGLAAATLLRLASQEFGQRGGRIRYSRFEKKC